MTLISLLRTFVLGSFSFAHRGRPCVVAAIDQMSACSQAITNPPVVLHTTMAARSYENRLTALGTAVNVTFDVGLSCGGCSHCVAAIRWPAKEVHDGLPGRTVNGATLAFASPNEILRVQRKVHQMRQLMGHGLVNHFLLMGCQQQRSIEPNLPFQNIRFASGVPTQLR